jgi:phosphoserine aminotransferase
MEQVNIAKARLLYEVIDGSEGFYSCPVNKEDRSRMNVPFKTRDAALDAEFIKQAEARGMLQLKGHKLAGGMRASIYNAMPLAGVKALADFMGEFAQRKG